MINQLIQNMSLTQKEFVDFVQRKMQPFSVNNQANEHALNDNKELFIALTENFDENAYYAKREE